MNAIYAIAYTEAWKIQDFNGVWTRDLAIPVRRINCVHNCEDHSLLDFTSAVQYMKYFTYNFIRPSQLIHIAYAQLHSKLSSERRHVGTSKVGVKHVIDWRKGLTLTMSGVCSFSSAHVSRDDNKHAQCFFSNCQRFSWDTCSSLVRSLDSLGGVRTGSSDVNSSSKLLTSSACRCQEKSRLFFFSLEKG